MKSLFKVRPKHLFFLVYFGSLSCDRCSTWAHKLLAGHFHSVNRAEFTVPSITASHPGPKAAKNPEAFTPTMPAVCSGFFLKFSHEYHGAQSHAVECCFGFLCPPVLMECFSICGWWTVVCWSYYTFIPILNPPAAHHLDLNLSVKPTDTSHFWVSESNQHHQLKLNWCSQASWYFMLPSTPSSLTFSSWQAFSSAFASFVFILDSNYSWLFIFVSLVL